MIVNWVVSLALLGLGAVSLIKNRSLVLNRVFAFFTVTIGIWIVASYISNDVHNSPHASVIGNYLVFFFSYISGYLLLWFAVALAEDIKTSRRLSKFTIPILLIGLTNFTPLVVAGAKRQGQVYAVEFGPLILLYFLGLVFFLGMAMYVLRKNIKVTSGEQRQHLVILYKCMSIALPIVLITEFILPAITGWFGLTNIGIIPMAIPVAGLYYSVVKLKLFNLQLAVVRSLAYLLTLAIIGSAYGLISYYITTYITLQTSSKWLEELLNVFLIIIAIAAYSPLIKIFRRITNALFYQDAYDPQAFLDELNKNIVSNIEIGILLRHTTAIIQKNLKCEFVQIGIRETDMTPMRIVGTKETDYSREEVKYVREHLLKKGHRRIVADELDQRDSHLKKILDDHKISFIIRLTSRADASGEALAYLIFGYKKSGNVYNSQDYRIVEIIADELVIAIQNALRFEEIENFNVTLQEKVVEATHRLRKANERLKVLDETKDDFISMASHQLRTPLTSIKGYLSMVIEGDTGKITPMQEKMLGQAFFSSQRMVYLIADLLNVSRLKTGKFIIEPSPVNLAEVVEQEMSQLTETAASRNLTLTYEKPKEFPAIMLDETKTRQVIMNFADNAIYYTPAGGHIKVELKETPTTIEFRVIDDGIGVAKSEQPHLFTKFYRAGNARQARPDGTGLGLFMAKKVIVGQGGALIFDSQEGKGSTFGFIFNKSQHAVPASMNKVPEPAKKPAAKKKPAPKKRS
ncbi:MAG TPA: ATP-binding protein [Candidatus Saccharimonadales bacterium]|nr:ATP-binding protein [Candidatus Saccharimonadales bacterium]